MPVWKIAGVQDECLLGEPARNLATLRARLTDAAAGAARLVVFPECFLTGYSFDSREEALPFAEPLPGPATEAVAADCRRLGVWAAFGLLEQGPRGELFNACALVGPGGLVATYRKIHLPYLGVDRFTTRGDRPFAVHDLGGLRIGMNICYDGGFPESARVLALLGADLILLPTNWPTGAAGTADFVIRSRAMENHVYYAAVNRIGTERGFRFIGKTRVAACDGTLLTTAGDGPEIVFADVDPEQARRKREIKVPGKYELDRIADRRPEMYGELVK